VTTGEGNARPGLTVTVIGLPYERVRVALADELDKGVVKEAGEPKPPGHGSDRQAFLELIEVVTLLVAAAPIAAAVVYKVVRAAIRSTSPPARIDTRGGSWSVESTVGPRSTRGLVTVLSDGPQGQVQTTVLDAGDLSFGPDLEKLLTTILNNRKP
jgi:hypothetical protein